MANESDKRPYEIQIEEEASGPVDYPWKLPARWMIEVTSASGIDFGFKAAIAIDGKLELVETKTPYKRQFVASRVIALFEADAEKKMAVSVYSDASGSYLRQAGFSGGSAGKLIFDTQIDVYLGGSL